ncbi:MAG: FKBP-type peptidyl-prolyl cis-trans isomerase [Alistipes sp.]|nr:FKBP-type peptidyl-prolyl cis-trans isomerase [Alistipes sp.]
MKKILIAALSLVTLASCGGGDKQMYFDNDMSRIYNDPTAEMDTLSYAVGMNVGLGLSLQNEHLNLQNDIVLATLDAELSKSKMDNAMLEENSKLMSRFNTELSRPYMMAKRTQAFIKTDRPDTLTLPEVYNDEFTPEKVSEMFGRDVAGYITRMALPVNTYWVFKAMEDATMVDSPKNIDSLMAITGSDVRTYMSNYATKDWAEYNLKRTAEWLDGVAKGDDVHSMMVEGDKLYYRVDKAGHGIRPIDIRDTVALSYEVFTRTGRPVESTAKRLEDMRNTLEQTREMKFVDEAQRDARIKQIEDQIEKVENLRIPLENFIIKGVQYAMKHVSEGGEITLWMPASLAYGERGNRAVGPNDGIVMRVKLKEVSKYVAEEEEALEEDATAVPVQPSVKVLPSHRPTVKKFPEGKKPMMIPVQTAPAPEKK